VKLVCKNNLNYFTTIERFFLSLKDSGLALSASDYQLIGKWEERRIPVELICRAIESGYFSLEGQRRGRHGNISLTQIQAIVEEEIQAEIHKK
jgi:hypothetical protein